MSNPIDTLHNGISSEVVAYIECLELALKKCRDRFQYYVNHHNVNGDYDKARGNEVMVQLRTPLESTFAKSF